RPSCRPDFTYTASRFSSISTLSLHDALPICSGPAATSANGYSAAPHADGANAPTDLLSETAHRHQRLHRPTLPATNSRPDPAYCRSATYLPYADGWQSATGGHHAVQHR